MYIPADGLSVRNGMAMLSAPPLSCSFLKLALIIRAQPVLSRIGRLSFRFDLGLLRSCRLRN